MCGVVLKCHNFTYCVILQASSNHVLQVADGEYDLAAA